MAQVVAYEFGPFRLDASGRVLFRGDEPVHLSPKAFDLLLVLIANSSRIVSREEILNKVWPDCFVEEINLNVQVSALRKALGDNAGPHKYILTVHGQGYRFGADVTEVRDQTNGSHAVECVETESPADEHIEEEPNDAVETGISDSETLAPARSVRKIGRPFWIILAMAATAILAAVVFRLFEKPTGSPTDVKPNSIAVLPFKLINPETEEYLGAGLADALITKLTSVKQVVVRPTSSVLKYQGGQQDLQVVGRELGVDLLLNGAIQISGDDIRVTAQLVKASDGVAIWGEEFRESYTNLFAVQDKIARRVVDALMLKLSEPENKQLAKRYTQNTQAYQLYMKGRFYWNKRTRQGLEKAIEQFDQAVSLDNNFALALTGLADSYILLGNSTNYAKAREAAARALEIDDSLAEAHTSLGHMSLFYDYDMKSAEAHFKRAIELNPNYATAHHWYALYFLAKGDIEGARAELGRALEIDPVSLIINTAYGVCHHYARQYKQALDQYRKVLEMDPNFVPAIHNTGMAYEQLGRFDEALAALNKAKASMRLSSIAIPHLYAVMGRTDEAKSLLAEMEKERAQYYVSAYGLAIICAGLGDKERAFYWLEQAFNDRDTWLMYLGVEPRLDMLRSDPRFADLEKRIGIR